MKQTGKAFLRNLATAAAVAGALALPAVCQVPGLVTPGQGTSPDFNPQPEPMPGYGAPQNQQPLRPGMGGGNSQSPIGGPSYGVPAGIPQPAGMRLAPQFSPDMWKYGIAAMNRIPVGTVLSGILEDEISSDDSKPGDVFSIRLEDGYSLNGKELLPKQTKIVGSVVIAVSAKSQHNGSPGKINISLQTLVLPDGRNTRFYGYVERNPNLNLKNKPGTDMPGKSVPGVAKRGVLGVLNMGLGRVGHAVQVPNIGSEFKIPKGELLPLKVTRSLDLNALAPAPVAVPGDAAGFGPVGPMQSGRVPGLSPNYVPGMVSPNGAPLGSVPYGTPQPLPSNAQVPGLVGTGAPQGAPYGTPQPVPYGTPVPLPPNSGSAPVMVPGAPGQGAGLDPFNSPIKSSAPTTQTELPDPF